MPPSSGELWGHHLMPTAITVDCLLPYGVIIPLNCMRDSTLESIKNDLWREARRYPLFDHLAEAKSYVFVSITQESKREEFYDENRRLCDLRLFQPLLKLVEPEGNKEEKIIQSKLGIIIGIPSSELDTKELEEIEFRRNILTVVRDSVDMRTVSIKNRALYMYPPDIDTSSTYPPSLLQKVEKGLIVCIWVLSNNGEKQKYTVKMDMDALPETLITEAILKTTKNMICL